LFLSGTANSFTLLLTGRNDATTLFFTANAGKSGFTNKAFGLSQTLLGAGRRNTKALRLTSKTNLPLLTSQKLSLRQASLFTGSTNTEPFLFTTSNGGLAFLGSGGRNA